MMIESRPYPPVLRALFLCLLLPTLVVKADSILDRMPNTTITLFVFKLENGLIERVKKLDGDTPTSFLGPTSPLGWINEEHLKNVKACGVCLKQISPSGSMAIVEFTSAEAAEKALAEQELEETEVEGVYSLTHDGIGNLLKRSGATLYLAPEVAGPSALKTVEVVKKSVTTVMTAEAIKSFESSDIYLWSNMPKIRPLMSIAISTLIGMMEQQTNAQQGIAGDSFILGRRAGTETLKGFRNLLMEASEFHVSARVVESGLQAHVRLGWEKGKYFDGVLKSSSQSTFDLLKGLPTEDSAFVAGIDMNSWAPLINDMMNVGFKRVLATQAAGIDAESLKNIETAIAKASFLREASQLSIAVVPSKEENSAVVGRFHSSDDAKAFDECVSLMNFGRDLAKQLGEAQGMEELKITDGEQGRRATMTTEDQSMHLSLAQMKSGLFWGVGQKIETLETLASGCDKDIDPTSAVGQILAKLTPKASVVVLLNARQLQKLVPTGESDSDEPSDEAPDSPGLAGITLAVRDSGFDLEGYFPAEFLKNLPDSPPGTPPSLSEEEPGEEEAEGSDEGPPEF